MKVSGWTRLFVVLSALVFLFGLMSVWHRIEDWPKPIERQFARWEAKNLPPCPESACDRPVVNRFAAIEERQLYAVDSYVDGYGSTHYCIRPGDFVLISTSEARNKCKMEQREKRIDWLERRESSWSEISSIESSRFRSRLLGELIFAFISAIGFLVISIIFKASIIWVWRGFVTPRRKTELVP